MRTVQEESAFWESILVAHKARIKCCHTQNILQLLLLRELSWTIVWKIVCSLIFFITKTFMKGQKKLPKSCVSTGQTIIRQANSNISISSQVLGFKNSNGNEAWELLLIFRKISVQNYNFCPNTLPVSYTETLILFQDKWVILKVIFMVTVSSQYLLVFTWTWCYPPLKISK